MISLKLEIDETDVPRLTNVARAILDVLPEGELCPLIWDQLPRMEADDLADIGNGCAELLEDC